MWLFRNQRSRTNLIEIRKGVQGYEATEAVDTQDSVADSLNSLFEWKVSEELDKKLINGYLMTTQQLNTLKEFKRENQLEL